MSPHRVPAAFSKIKNAVLGKRYDLSVAFISPAAMRRAMKYKKMTTGKISNVLAFPLSKNSGEILICKKRALPFTVAYLFIHALLHLKGHRHGGTMEREERRLLRQFGFRAHE